MINNLSFSLNATLPIFLIMVFGYILKKINFLSSNTTSEINKFVFKIALPALLYEDLAKQNFVGIWDTRFVLFCSLSTLISIVICVVQAKFFKTSDKGEFIQASYRSAAATLGLAFMTNIYDNVAMVALMILASVPIYNIIAVITLSFTSTDKSLSESKGKLFKKTLLNIIKNPIIIGIVIGLISSLINPPEIKILERCIHYLAATASPLTLIALGASFEFKDLSDNLKTIILINFNKLILFCLIFLPLAIGLGFRNEKMVAALIMLGSATTSSSFIMSKNMGHSGSISSSSVMTTTLISSFTLTLWLFILKSMGYI